MLRTAAAATLWRWTPRIGSACSRTCRLASAYGAPLCHSAAPLLMSCCLGRCHNRACTHHVARMHALQVPCQCPTYAFASSRLLTTLLVRSELTDDGHELMSEMQLKCSLGFGQPRMLQPCHSRSVCRLAPHISSLLRQVCWHISFSPEHASPPLRQGGVPADA